MSRTLIQGDKKAGFTIFWADDGLDTGPILLQRECDVGQNDTVDDLYNRFLFPEGIKAMVCLAALNINILRGKEKHLLEFESKGNIDKIHAFGETGCVAQLNPRLQWSCAASRQLRRWPQEICYWQRAERILFPQKARSQLCLECGSFHRFLECFCKVKFFKGSERTGKLQKVRGEVEKKKEDGVLSSKP